jgi:hypothetical protein
MRSFFDEQDRTRVFVEAYKVVLRRRPLHKPQAQTRGERRSSEKGPFMDGNYLVEWLALQQFFREISRGPQVESFRSGRSVKSLPGIVGLN